MSIVNPMTFIKSNTKPKCPRCGADPRCAIEDGKSISACWCLTYKLPEKLLDNDDDGCYCRNCIRELLDEEKMK